MATRFASLCKICSKIFNKIDRKAVPLPCGHSFCSSCLNRLKKTDCRRCMICRKEWTDFENQGQHFFGKESKEITFTPFNLEPDYKRSWRSSSFTSIVCKKHCQPYLYWCEEHSDIYCKKCVKLQGDHRKLDIIEDAVPDIKKSFSSRVKEVKGEIQADVDACENALALATQKLSVVRKFKEKIEKLEHQLVICMKDIKSINTRRTNDSNTIKKATAKIEKISTKYDILKIENCRDMLVDLAKKMPSPSNLLEETNTLLFDIAASYMADSTTAGDPSPKLFIQKLVQKHNIHSTNITPSNNINTQPTNNNTLTTITTSNPTTTTTNNLTTTSNTTTTTNTLTTTTVSNQTTDSLKTTSINNIINNHVNLTEIAQSAQSLKDNERWVVDNGNCLAAVCALALRKPSRLAVISRDDRAEGLPSIVLAALMKGVPGCEVWVRFLDSFYKPLRNISAARDRERLEHVMRNRRLTLSRFFGHLDAAGIAMLPQTVARLGLTIGSTADADAVADMAVWDNLTALQSPPPTPPTTSSISRSYLVLLIYTAR